jgi:uncharacterized repeat protein (TIGR03803 family)
VAQRQGLGRSRSRTLIFCLTLQSLQNEGAESKFSLRPPFLYGTTVFGGASGNSVVFNIDPSGNETVLRSFTGGADGARPHAGVVFGPNGNLYGTTPFGGQTNAGVVFEIKPW